MLDTLFVDEKLKNDSIKDMEANKQRFCSRK